jgi:hypothetical protein
MGLDQIAGFVAATLQEIADDAPLTAERCSPSWTPPRGSGPARAGREAGMASNGAWPRDLEGWTVVVGEWCDRKGWRTDDDRPAELICLMHSELSEALEHLRDGHDPGASFVTEAGKPDGPAIEMADVLIRVFDYAGRYGIDLQAALEAKQSYNEGRPYQHGGRVLHPGRADRHAGPPDG